MERSDDVISMNPPRQKHSKLTEAKKSRQKKSNCQEREADEEVAVLSDCWDEWTARGALPDLVQ